LLIIIYESPKQKERERSMKQCTYPDCDRLTEGATDYCATHGREIRKAKTAIERGTRTRRDNEYQKQVKKWKAGKTCALKFHSKCSGPITCHHKRGRIGQLLLDKTHWLPVCLGHHQYIENHPEESYKKGWSELRLANEPHKI